VTALVNEFTTNRVRRCWCSTTTARELEILRLLAAGLRNPRIAAELVVTIDTVKEHVSHILGKLGAANHTEAVTRARELGLIP
jgi:LuxR family maltose regulon positive regulatory protein